MSYDGLPDAGLLEWQRNIHTGATRASREEVEALIGEVVRLRRLCRRLDRQILAAQQQGLFANDLPKRPRVAIAPE